jgi:hypothetical protein
VTLEDLPSVIMNTDIFWLVTCIVALVNFLEECVASIFRIEEYVEHGKNGMNI